MDLATLLHGGASTRRAYTETYAKRSLQAPLSPPMEDQPKCSLPSISTLLEGADGAQHSAKRQRLSPPAHQREARYDTVCMPPTPPLRPGSGSGHSSIAHSPVDLNTPKHTSPHQHPHRSSISSTASSTAPQPHHAHRTSIPYASPAPSISSSASSTTAYTSPVETNSSTTLYYSHSRPQTTAINTTTSATSSTTTLNQQSPSNSSPTLISPVTPAWPHQHQHHHYFPPSSAAPYQQNPDRYICRTCHKAFSRPSSLRIHSHSHTGEKPFHCTHPGCGKAFSVRSNMKRHERGCHSGRPAVPAPQLVS